MKADVRWDGPSLCEEFPWITEPAVNCWAVVHVQANGHTKDDSQACCSSFCCGIILVVRTAEGTLKRSAVLRQTPLSDKMFSQGRVQWQLIIVGLAVG